MDITYISLESVSSPLAESVQVAKMCDAMISEGHDVRLIAPLPKSELGLRNGGLAQIYDLRHNIEPLYRSLPPSHLGRTWYAMMGRLSSFGRIAYTRFGSCAAVCVYTGARTVFDLDALPKSNSPAELVLKRLLRNQSPRLRIAVITEALRQMVAERYSYADTDKMIIAPNGVDTIPFDYAPGRDEARQTLNLPGDKPIVGHVGSLSPSNGVETLAQLVSQMPEVHFLMVGDRGDGLNRLRGEAGDSGAGTNLIAPGNVDNSEVPLWLSACDILLLANQILPGWENRNALYTSPMKLFEYMASGKPIIASDLPILREILDEDTAVFVPSSDIGAWIEAIRNLLKDPARGKALGATASQRAAEHYSWRTRAHTILDGLEQP